MQPTTARAITKTKTPFITRREHTTQGRMCVCVVSCLLHNVNACCILVRSVFNQCLIVSDNIYGSDIKLGSLENNHPVNKKSALLQKKYTKQIY